MILPQSPSASPLPPLSRSSATRPKPSSTPWPARLGAKRAWSTSEKTSSDRKTTVLVGRAEADVDSSRYA